MDTFWKWCTSFIVNNDTFAEEAEEENKNDDHKTFFGGIVSLIIRCIVFYFAVLSVVMIFNRVERETATKVVVEDIRVNSKMHYVGQNGFTLAISYKNASTTSVHYNYLADKTYFNVYFTQQILKRYDNLTLNESTISIGMKNCDEKIDFEGIDHEVLKDKNITNYLCPVQNNYTLHGDFNSREFHYIRSIITKWINSTENSNHWKAEEEIDRVVNSGYIDIALVNSYFDFDDYENPIKKYLSSTNNMFMTNDGNTQWFEGLIKENEAFTSDGWIYNEPFESQKFYSITDIYYKVIPSKVLNKSLAYISFGMARELNHLERNAYNLAEMFSFLGGLYDSLFFLGFLFISVTHSKLFDFRA